MILESPRGVSDSGGILYEATTVLLSGPTLLLIRLAVVVPGNGGGRAAWGAASWSCRFTRVPDTM